MSRQLHFTENTHFRVLRLLEANPKLSQRELHEYELLKAEIESIQLEISLAT